MLSALIAPAEEIDTDTGVGEYEFPQASSTRTPTDNAADGRWKPVSVGEDCTDIVTTSLAVVK